MSIHASFKRLILRAVLRNVSPMVIRILAVPDSLDLFEFDEVFRAVLGWDNIGFLFRVHGQVRRLDEDPGSVGDDVLLCLGGRGAAPPQFCGGPTGYRLMLKRQRMGEAMCTPVQMEAVLGMLAAADPEVPPENWRCYREILREGFESIDRRLQEYGPLEPERFSLEEANNRLARREDLMRWRRV